MLIGCFSKFLHHANEVLIIPWNKFPISGSVPEAPQPQANRLQNLFFQCLPLSQFTQPDQRLMAFVIAPVNQFASCSLPL